MATTTAGGQKESLVPWANAAEWEAMFEALYSPVIEVRLQGVRRFRAWSARSSKIPTSVEATATFVSIQAQDVTQACGMNSVFMEKSPLSQFQIRLLYSMAFVRFINGLCDAAQKGMFAASVASIAQQLGLPVWFVDLRHAATHDGIPGIAILRSGCTHALAWLRERYWLPQQNYVKDVQQRMLHAIKHYKSRRKLELKTTEQSRGTTKCLEHFNECVKEAGSLIPLLFQQGLLIPSTKKKRVASHSGTFLSDALPTELLQLWEPFLAECHTRWPETFYSDVMEYIITSITSESKSYLYTCIAWAIVLFKWMIHPTADSNAAAQLTRCIGYICLGIDSSSENPIHIAKLLVPQVEQLLQKIPSVARTPAQTASSSLCTLARLKESMSLKNISSLLETVKSLKTNVRLVGTAADSSAENEVSNADQTSTDKWCLQPAADWGDTPIGCLPDNIFPILELPGFEDESFLEYHGILRIPTLRSICKEADGADQSFEEASLMGTESDIYTLPRQVEADASCSNGKRKANVDYTEIIKAIRLF